MACSGTRQSNNITTANNPHGSTPLGVYTASDIQVGPGEVRHIDLIFAEQNFYGPQTYEQTLDGCLFMLAPGVNPPPCLHIVSRDDTYTNGHWVDPKGNQGSVLIPAEKGNMINQVLNIRTRTTSLLVKFGPPGHQVPLPALKFHPTMFAPVWTP